MDLEIWQGDAQNYVIALTNSDTSPVSLTNKTAQAAIRSTFGSVTSYAFTCTIQNGNEVKLYMSSAVTKTMAPGDYIWDFSITDTVSTDVRTYLAGDVKVYGEVN
jgi:predicted secreted protein